MVIVVAIVFSFFGCADNSEPGSNVDAVLQPTDGGEGTDNGNGNLNDDDVNLNQDGESASDITDEPSDTPVEVPTDAPVGGDTKPERDESELVVENPPNVDKNGFLSGVWMSQKKHVWVVGSYGLILRRANKVWESQPSGVDEHLNDVFGRSDTELWAVGDGGTLLGYNGSQWSAAEVNSNWDADSPPNFNGVWVTAIDDSYKAFVVGDAATVLIGDGNYWTQMVAFLPNGKQADFLAVAGINSDYGRVWAVGTGGTLMRYNGKHWGYYESGTKEDLNGVSGSKSLGMWVVGAAGTVLHSSDDETWQKVDTGFDQHLYGIQVFDQGNAVAVGSAGTILQRSPINGTWSSIESKVTGDLLDVHGTDLNNLYMVGSIQGVLKADL
jgi:hypothetical protein